MASGSRQTHSGFAMASLRGNNMGLPENHVSVISSDMWLDRPHGASLIRIFEKLAEIRKWNIDLFIFSTKKTEEKRNFLQIHGLEIPGNLKESSYSYYLYTMNKSIKLMRELGGAIIFDYPLIPSFMVAKLLGRNLHGIALVLSRPIYNKPLHPKNLAYRASLLLGRLFVNRFTAITPFEAKEIGKLTGENKVVVIPSVLAHEFLDPPENCKDLLQEYLGDSLEFIESEEKLLLYHGVLDERRGIEEILRSFSEAFRERGISLGFLGKGPAVSLVIRYQERNTGIRYLGSVPLSVVPCVIRLASVGIAWLPDEPRWRYQLPTKVLEFMAMEKPFITNSLPGILWAVDKCPLAIYQSDMSPKSLRESVSKALGSRDPSNLCRRRASSFSANKIAKLLGDLIESILTP